MKKQNRKYYIVPVTQSRGKEKEFSTLVINLGGKLIHIRNQSNSKTKTLSERNKLEQVQNVLGQDQIWLSITTNDLDSMTLTG